MKKFLAILLAMMLVMVSVAALATEGGTTEGTTEGGTTEGGSTEGGEGNAADIDYEKGTTYDQAATAPFTVEIDKTYGFAVLDGASIPAHTLTFSVEATGVDFPGAAIDMDNLPEVTIDELEITEAEAGPETSTYPLTINMPAFPEVGVYNYTITEDNTNVAGVTYHTSPLYLRVTVVRTEDGELQVAGIALREEETTDPKNPDTTNKIDSLDNTFSSGAVKIKKIVTGNMGDYSKEWHITVTFTSDKTVNNTIKYTTVDGVEHTITPGWSESESVEITLKHDEEVTFENVPTDVSYSFEEAEANQDDYTTTYTDQEGDIVAGELSENEIENNKELTPDTGITLETLPYVLMMALAVMGLAALRLRKREEY